MVTQRKTSKNPPSSEPKAINEEYKAQMGKRGDNRVPMGGGKAKVQKG